MRDRESGGTGKGPQQRREQLSDVLLMLSEELDKGSDSHLAGRFMWWDSSSKACRHSRSSRHSCLARKSGNPLKHMRVYVCISRHVRLWLAFSCVPSFMLKLNVLSEDTFHLGSVSPSVE